MTTAGAKAVPNDLHKGYRHCQSGHPHQHRVERIPRTDRFVYETSRNIESADRKKHKAVVESLHLRFFFLVVFTVLCLSDDRRRHHGRARSDEA